MQPLLPASSLKIEPTWTEAYRVSDYLRAAGRRWKMAILTTLAGLSAAYGWCWLMPDTYVSYAQLLFMPPQVSEKFVETNISLHADQRVTALTQMIGSHVTAGKMIQEFGLYPRLRRWWPVADLVPQFRSDLDIRVIGAGRTDGRRAVPTVQISFKYTDPRVAQKVVQRILEVIYEENQRIRSNQTFRTTDFLQRQTKEVHDQLELAEQRLETLRLGDPAARLQATALATEKLHEVHRRLYATQLDLRRAISEREQKQLQLDSLKERAANPAREATKSIDASWAMQGWRMKLAELRARADEAQLRYREGHPDRESAIRDVERALAELKRVEETDRQHDENQLKQRLVDQFERTKAEVNGLDASIATMKREEVSLLTQEKEAIARSLPNEQAAFQNLAALRDHELLKLRYAELLKKQRDSEVATEMERIGQGETIDLIEPPVLPTMAKLPVEWMKLMMGAVAGLLAGLLMPVLSLIHRPRIQSAHRLEALLGAPLLGELPAAPNLGPAGFHAMRWRGRKIRLVISTQSILALVLFVALTLSGCARDSAASLVERGHAAWKKGKTAEAALLFRRAIQEDKRFGLAYRAMADLALEQSDAPAARRALIRAVELLPEEPALRVKLAELSFRLYFADPSRPESLLRELEMLADQIVEHGPKQPDGYRLRAQVLLERRRLRDAIATLEEGLQNIPGEPALITQLASALYQDGDTARAGSVLETLVKAESAYPPAYDLAYMQLMEAGRRQQGEAVLRTKWKAIGSLDSGLQLAAHLDATGARDAALELLETVAAKHASNALAPLQIADFWINRADPERARQWLDRGRRAHPSAAPEYAGRQIELLLGANQRDAALALLAAEQKAHPGNQLLAAYRSAIALDDPGAATLRQTRVHLEAILNRMPNSPFVRYHLGRAYLREGDVARAGDQFERCVTLDPNYAMGWLALAESHLRQGQYSRAAEESKYLQHRGAAFASVYLVNARAELGRNRPADAERSLEILLRLDPGHNEGKLLMSQTKLALGQTAAARKTLYELLERGAIEQPETLVAAARMEASLGQPEKAIERLRKAGEQKPDSLAIGAGIAQLASRLGRHEEALTQYRRLVERQPSSLEYSLGYANALALLKKNQEAADQYKKVQTMSGVDPRPWLNYAVMMAESGDWEQARAGYREALRREPRNPIALNNLADLLSRRGGDLSEALNFAEQAGRMLPDAPEVIDTLAYVYLQKGMMRNAIASYQKLMDRVPGPERGRIRTRIERIERGDVAGVLAETRPARM